LSKINDPAILAERRLLRAQLRSLGLAPNAVVEIAARAGGQTSAALSEELTRTAGPIEARHALVQFRDVEFRDAQGTGDGSYTLTGYAAVYGVETVLYDGSWWRFREVIAPEAFVPVLGRTPDVHLNIGHDMTRAIARTGIDGVGGLELASDDQGLRVFARLDPADPDVVSLAAKMNRGIVDQMTLRVHDRTREVRVRDRRRSRLRGRAPNHPRDRRALRHRGMRSRRLLANVGRARRAQSCDCARSRRG